MRIEDENLKKELRHIFEYKSEEVREAEWKLKKIFLLNLILNIFLAAAIVLIWSYSSILKYGVFFLIIFCLIAYWSLKKKIDNVLNNINKVIKDGIVLQLFQNIVGECQYEPEAYIMPADFYASGLFKDMPKTIHEGNDYLEIEKNGVKTKISELSVTYETGSGKSRTVHNQFKGVFFVNEFNSWNQQEYFVAKVYKKVNLVKTIIISAIVLFLIMLFSRVLLFIGIIVVAALISSIKNREKKELQNRILTNHLFDEKYIVKGNSEFIAKSFPANCYADIEELKKRYNTEVEFSYKKGVLYSAFSTKCDMFETTLKGFDKKYLEHYKILKKCVELNEKFCTVIQSREDGSYKKELI